MKKLLLFDIDGTLVSAGGAGRRGLDAAFEQVFGWKQATQGVPFAGKTDPLIVADVFWRHGQPGAESSDFSERFEAVMANYLVALRRELSAAPEASVVLPGVERLLDTLEARGDVVLGLLTGNVQSGAREKLGHHDLFRRFALGAYGDDAENREGLPPVALLRAEAKLGFRAAHPQDVVIIGDTPRDIACARAHDLRAVAVATGPFKATQLSAYEPDALLEDLSETATVLAALGL